MGFQARCNCSDIYATAASKIVSIPNGFSSSLQRRPPPPGKQDSWVSIPNGFSSSLQPDRLLELIKMMKSFNP